MLQHLERGDDQRRSVNHGDYAI